MPQPNPQAPNPGLANPPASGEAQLAALLDEHGIDGLGGGSLEDRREDAAPAPAKAKPKPAEPQAVVDEEGAGDEGEFAFDDATLEALGLKESAPVEPNAGAEDDGDDGTESEGQLDLASLAKTLGLEATDLSVTDGAIYLKTKVDGEEGQVSLQDLRKGYQLQSHFTRQQEAFLQQKKAWEQQQQAEQHRLAQNLTMSAAVLADQEQALNREFTLDWKALQVEDPAMYAAKMTEYQVRRSELNNRRQAIGNQLMAHQQQVAQAQKQAADTFRNAETDALISAMKLTGRQAAESKQAELKNYLAETYGLERQALDSSMVTHQAFMVAEKARLYDALVAKVSKAKKKVSGAPPMPAAGGQRAPQQTKAKKRVKAALQAHSEKGSLESAAAVFDALGIP